MKVQLTEPKPDVQPDSFHEDQRKYLFTFFLWTNT